MRFITIKQKKEKKRGKRCSSGLVKDEIKKRTKHGNIYVTIKLFKTFSEKKKRRSRKCNHITTFPEIESTSSTYIIYKSTHMACFLLKKRAPKLLIITTIPSIKITQKRRRISKRKRTSNEKQNLLKIISKKKERY